MSRLGRSCVVALLLAVSISLSTSEVRYGTITGRHPSTPLLELPAVTTQTHCAATCQVTTGCVSWDLTAAACLLYPGVLADPTSDTIVGAVWGDLWIPDSYHMAPGGSRAFRAHNERTIANGKDIPIECALDHPKAAGAFIENTEQLEFAKSLITDTVWTGIWHLGSGARGDFPGTRTVQLLPEWYAPDYTCDNTNNCARLFLDGLHCRDCGRASHGYICEYELLG